MNNKKIIGILGLATMSTMIVAPSVPITIHSKNEQDASIEKQKDNQDSNVKKQKEESNLAQDKDSNTANVLKVGNNTNEVNKATLENNQKSLENTKNQNATDVKGLAKNANTSTKKQAKDTTKNISGVSAKDTTGTSKESTKVNKDTASTTQVKASKLVATPKSTTTQNNLDNASIIIGNVWYQNIGTLSFDSSTMKFEFTGSWAETNPYASSKEVLFKISLVGTNGVVANTIDIYGGGEKPQTKLANFFNNLKFEYGDKLLITIVNSSSKISAKGTVDNGDISTKDYNVTKTTAFNLEKTGLSVFTKQNLTVNPLPIEGASNKITSCTVTGRTVPESDVTVQVDGKTFTTKANYVGTFSVPVTDENGLKSSTGITVCVAGQVPVTVYPSAIPNLGISKASIVTSYNCKLTGETIKFNPASLQVNISESGTNQFSANLIADGKPVAKSETSYFSGFSGSKDLKNADFKYGDIISVYQTNQAQILWNNPSINTGTSSSGLSPEKFAYYQITSKGLVPVTNANLTVNQPYYDGNSSVDVTGETKANTNVIVSVGSYSTTVRSNSTGAYTASIPESDISVGDVVSVYVDGSNFKQIIYNYSPSYALGTSKIQVSNYYGQPIFYVGFNPESLKLTANKNVTYYNYGGGQQTGSSVGTFYTNRLKFKLINSTNGNVIYNISTDKLNDATDFVNGINGKSYSVGDILEVSYNPSLLNIDTTNGKTSVSSQNTSNQYFEITNKGLVNVNNKFINVKPLNVLGTNLTSANVTGNASPNASLTVRVGDKTFTGTANSNGKFSIPITSVGGFNSSTNIVASSNGFIPTNVKLGYSSSVNIQNSHINFYNESTSVSGIQSSIGFNPSNMSFTVQNYTNSFGKGNEDYFTMGLYEANGKTVINPTLIKNGSASAVTDLLNGKSFKYGDVISLSYNPNISIPVALNNQSVIANISGATEYFEITKAGLVRVNFGEKIYTSSVKWNNGSLELDVTPSVGNNLALTNGVIEILDSSNKVITSSNINNGSVTFEASKLKMLTNENDYKFEVKLNNKSLPVYVNSNIPSNSNYKLFTNTENELSIKLNHVNYAIKSANDIVSYSKKTSDAVTGLITSNDAMGTTLANQKSMNDVITNAFINRFGLSKLQSFYNDNQSNASFLNWVLNNDVAMSEYLQATNIGQANINSLQIWSDIWNEYTNSHNGFNLKLAIATAIANEVTIHDCFNGQAVGSPVQRYNIFENINSEGGMVKGFDTLNVKLLESVVDVPITNPQIKEMRSLLLQNHNNIVRTNNLPVTDYSINYTFRNPYNGASIFESWEKFYGKNSTVADVFKIGGVCGSISRLGSIACRVFGQPAHQMGEPGHDAFYSYDLQNGKWYSQYGETTVAKATGFDVSGWSNGLALNSYIVTYNALYTAANNKNLIKSNQYLWMANSSISYNLKLQAINNAIAAQPLNVEAWLAKINLLKSNPKVTAQDYINLSNDLIAALKDYPEPMFDLLVKFNRNMIQVTTTTQYNTFVNKVKSTLEAIESNGNESQKTQANRILNDGYMTKYGFTTNQQRLLGQININSWQRSEPTESIKFSDNNKIVATGINTWIADQGNTGIKVDFFDANMNNQKSLNINGTECGSTMANSLNGNAFTNGEIIEIQYTPSDRNHGYLSMEGSDLATKNIPNIVAIQVTKDGLKVLDGPYTAPNGKHYNFYSGFKTTANGTEYDIFGTPQKGMQTINNKKYYFNNDGIMQTGLQTIDNSGYYFNKDGVMQTGWQTIDGQSYYFNDNGYAMPGYQTIDGKKYLFANNGLEIQNIISNSNMKVSSYSTEQNNTTYSANNIIDGNLNNNWQNIWNRSDKHPYITIELSHPYNLNTLVCFPRQDGGWNGDIQKYKILISMNGKDFTQVAQGNWTYSKSNESQFANLNGVEAKYVKIESDEGISNLATISEVVLSGTDLVNKTTLKNDIAKGETFEKNAKEYSSASIQALTNALANGKVVLDNSKATKTDVNDAQSTITNAIIGLRTNKEVLEKEINIAVNDIKDKNIYTDASITNLTNAISNAKVIDTNTNATVKQVENATNGLINAINNLGVNKETLENDIKKAKEILSSGKGYTQDSIDYLSHEILNGESVIKNKNATVTDVSTAIKNLQAAIDALRANKSDLLNEISKANSILQNSSAYTSESIKVLKNFDNAAQGVLNNPKATLVQVRTAVASILSGINGLKLNETGLVNEINIAKEKLKDSSKYSKATIASLNKAVVDGENVVSNQNATPTNVKIATNDLENAIAALKPNKEGLQNAITTGKNRLGIADGYTKVSINNLSNAILSGQKVLENNNATAQEINSAIKNINTAMNALKASKVELQNAINTADNIFKNANEYTMQSIQTLSNFVIAGQAVMNNQSATPAQVRTATVSILSGIKGLKANEQGLDSAISNGKYKLKEGSKYTKVSIDALNKAILNGEEVTNNPNATVQMVEASEVSINNAIKNLVTAPVIISPSKKDTSNNNSGTKTTDGTGSNDKPVVKPSTTNSGTDKKVEPKSNEGTKTTDGTGSNDKPVVKPSTSTTNSGSDKKVEPNNNSGTKTTDSTGSNDKPVVKPSTSITNSGTDKKVEPKSNEGTKTTDGTGSNDKPAVVKPNTSTTNSGTNSIWNEAENIWHDVSVGWHDIWFGGQNHDNSSVTKEPSKATNISSNISTGTKEDQGIVNNQSNTTKNNNKNNDVKTLSSNGNEAKGLNNPKVDSSKADNTKVNLATTNATIAKVSEPSKVQNKDENTDKDIPYGVGGAVVAGIIAAGLYFGFKRRKKDDE